MKNAPTSGSVTPETHATASMWIGKSENQSGHGCRIAVLENPQGKVVGQHRCQQVSRDGRQVPQSRLATKKGVLKSHPNQEDRPIVIPRHARIDPLPHAGGEILRQIAPGMNGRVVDQKHEIVVHKSETQRPGIGQKGRGENEEQHQPVPRRRTGTALAHFPICQLNGHCAARHVVVASRRFTTCSSG